MLMLIEKASKQNLNYKGIRSVDHRKGSLLNKKPFFRKESLNMSDILQKLHDYDPIPQPKIMNKMDVYINPYNVKLGYGKHMVFDSDSEGESEHNEVEVLKRHKSLKKWQKISDLILNTNEKLFISSIKSINNSYSMKYLGESDKELEGQFTIKQFRNKNK